MTNGTGKQLTTIRENIFRKYGRYQVHPRKDDHTKQVPDDSANAVRLAMLKKVAPEMFATGPVADDVLQDIHDREDR